MVNGKRKSGKKPRNASNTIKKDKRGPSSLPNSLSKEWAPVVTSLPPAVDGHLRCFLRVSVSTIYWKIPNYPEDVQVRLKWWGEHGAGVLFRPVDDNKTPSQKTESSRFTCVQYPVCSGPRQFNAYLKDMGPLIFEVVHGPSLILFGQAKLGDVTQLSASTPINGLFDVISTSSPTKKLADLYVALRFESTSAAYSQLSSTMIPTVDLDIDQGRAMDESDVHPSPPVSLNPATPIPHPRHEARDPFVSPAIHTKGVKFSAASPERLEYTAEHSLISSPVIFKKHSERDVTESKDSGKGALTSRIRATSPLATTKDDPADVSSDLIGALLKRGERLREAMVMSAEEEDNSMEEVEHEVWNEAVGTKRSPPAGKLFTEILASQDTYGLLSSKDDSTVTDSVMIHDNKAVDLVLGEEEVHYLEESPQSSPEGSTISESGDPLYDETLLQDLFYTTAAQTETGSEDTISSDDEQNVTMTNTSLEEKESKRSLQNEHNSPVKRNIMRRIGRDAEASHSFHQEKATEETTSMGYIDPTAPSNSGRHNLSGSPSDSSSTSAYKEIGSPDHKDFIENLGPEKLTALGRADTARVIVESLVIGSDHLETERNVPGTFFIEYHFPASTSARNQELGVSMATEVTRIASKKVQEGAVLFNHRSVFPVFFNAAVTDHWWRRALTFRLYHRQVEQRMPSVLGVAALPLKTILQSDSLSSSASLQIKDKIHSSHTHSPSSSDSGKSAIIGPLLVKVELMADGKPLHIKPSLYKKPPLPSTTTAVKMVDHARVLPSDQALEMRQTSQQIPSSISLSKKKLEKKPDEIDVISNSRETLTLHTLLWIPEGKGIGQHGYHGKLVGPPGIVLKNNLYLVCRMFWCEEVSKSRVCWGDINPQFGFKQVAPVMLTPTLLQRACNNFMVVEVWNRITPPGDTLIGLVKLPLHQLYLSYRDPKITKTILKSKYPVVAVDEWSVITNPFTNTQHGHIRVLLAMGSEEQIAAMLSMKCGGELPHGIETRPDHHLDMDRDEGKRKGVPSSKHQELVEHQFEITVEDIRGLSIFGSTVWGETDCFVQYHFPAQRQHDLDETNSEAIPSLAAHRTPTTLCVPDPTFHDVARHTFMLLQGFPVQKHLQAAFTGSWVLAPLVPGSGGVPFELWRRYYYPNIRDQMVAKASLPLAKLCAMVTMQKHGETNIQTFSLPLKALPGDELDSMRHDRMQGTGLLDVSVKYQQVKTKKALVGSMTQAGEENHVCVSLQISRACGLKAATVLHSKHNPSLSYPAEVGVNTYLVLQVPLGKKHEHLTRTVARTFSPEFSYHVDMLLPIVSPPDTAGRGNLSLAEQLETSQLLFEVWHQVSQGVSSAPAGEVRSRRKEDVLLGVGRVPLIKLLTHRTGIRGWYAVYVPSEGATEHDATPKSQMNNTDVKEILGGLELSVGFSEAENRDHVIHISRGLGWAPPPGVDCHEDLVDTEELSDDKRVEFCLKIDKAWIPVSEVHCFNAGAKKMDQRTVLYARYKFYDRAPICTRLSQVKQAEEGNPICELKHSNSVVLPASASLSWYMREECLEIQLWLSSKRHDTAKGSSQSRKRDRLLGSAFMDMSALITGQKHKQKHISGLYPLFRAGASDLFGACVHVQASLLTEDQHTTLKVQDAEESATSDESVSTDSSTGDHNLQSQDHKQTVHSKEEATKGRPVTEDDNDSFMAHVIIEQALHLPVLSGSKGERLLPNVYVSYQTQPSDSPSFTKVAVSSSCPCWGYQKLERICFSSLKTQGIVFKLWHRSERQEGGSGAKLPETAEGILNTSSGDHVLGFVSFDLAPLAAGMRQLIGWYNVTDFNGQCKGQIKLGVAPVTCVSPSRCLPVSRTVHFHPATQEEPLDQMFVERESGTHLTTGNGFAGDIWNQRSARHQVEDAASSQLPLHLQTSTSSQIIKHTDTSSVNLSDCSSSVLFSHLRQNLKELDALQQDLNTKLTRDEWNEPPSVIPTQTGGLLIRGNTRAGAEGRTSTSLGFEQFNSAAHDAVTVTNPTHVRLTTSNEEETYKTYPPSSQMMPLAASVPTGKLHGVSLDRETFTTAVKLFSTDNAGKHDHSDAEVHSITEKENTKPSDSRHSSIDSDPSASSVSEDLSMTGYVKENMESRFADLQDSWLSDEEEEGVVKNSDNFKEVEWPRTPPSDGNVEQRHEITYAAGSSLDPKQGTKYFVEMNDNPESEKDAGRNNGEEDSDVEVTERSSERNTGQRNMMSLNKLPDVAMLSSEVNDENSDGHHYSEYSDTTGTRELPRELPRESPLFYVHSNRQASAPFQNFFMPTEELAESMRALRLGHSSHMGSSVQSRLLARQRPAAQGKLGHEFTKRQPMYKAKKDTRPPISSSEADRIARIFNSGGVS